MDYIFRVKLENNKIFIKPLKTFIKLTGYVKLTHISIHSIKRETI